MEAVCKGHFSRVGKEAVKGNTTQEAFNHICVVLEKSGWGNLSKIPAGKLKLTLGKQVRGYTKTDPPTKHQKALPTIVYCNNLAHTRTPLCRAQAVLLMGALFFAMQSYEYTLSGSHKDCCTKTIELQNIRFFKNRKERKHSHSQLHLSDSISIMFYLQKNDHTGDTVTMHKSGDHAICPVLA